MRREPWRKARDLVECTRALSLIAPYLAGRIAGPNGRSLERHCRACLSCAKTLRSQQALRAAVRASFPEAIAAPEGLKETIALCIRCMESPGRTACPRLRRRFRLASSRPDGVT